MTERLYQGLRKIPLLRKTAGFLRDRIAAPFVPAVWLQSPTYLQWRRFLSQSQHWPPTRHRAYQLAMLRRLLAHAERNVPYYKRLFAEHGIFAKDCHDLEYIQNIPPLTKALVRENLQDLIALSNRYDGEGRKFTSGGSTGEPLAIYRSDEGWAIENAFIHRSWGWLGFKPGDRILQIRGNVVDRKRLDKGLHWQIDRKQRLMLLSPYSIGPDTLEQALSVICRFRPRFMHAYPTSALLLAQTISESGARFKPDLDALLLGSEPVYPHQRKLLEEVFSCRVFSHYGQAEGVAYAAECQTSNEYHLAPEYAIVELLASDTMKPAAEGDVAEIIGTSLTNFAFPLIRYRSDDYVRVGDGASECFHGFPKLGFVLGRGQDVIVRNDGGHIPLTSYSFGRHMAAYERMQAMQFEQSEPGKLLLRIVRGKGYSQTDEDELLGEFEKNGRGAINLKLEYVDEIERSKAGKLRHLIQRLDVSGPYRAKPDWGPDG